MAPRTRKAKLDDFTRERIQTTQIVKRLTEHVFDRAEMSRSQVAAAIALLKKSLPDLQSTALTNSDGSDLTVKHNVTVEYVKGK